MGSTAVVASMEAVDLTAGVDVRVLQAQGYFLQVEFVPDRLCGSQNLRFALASIFRDAVRQK